jgi:hypothetical protein
LQDLLWGLHFGVRSHRFQVFTATNRLQASRLILRRTDTLREHDTLATAVAGGISGGLGGLLGMLRYLLTDFTVLIAEQEAESEMS